MALSYAKPPRDLRSSGDAQLPSGCLRGAIGLGLGLGLGPGLGLVRLRSKA